MKPRQLRINGQSIMEGALYERAQMLRNGVSQQVFRIYEGGPISNGELGHHRRIARQLVVQSLVGPSGNTFHWRWLNDIPSS